MVKAFRKDSRWIELSRRMNLNKHRIASLVDMTDRQLIELKHARKLQCQMERDIQKLQREIERYGSDNIRDHAIYCGEIIVEKCRHTVLIFEEVDVINGKTYVYSSCRDCGRLLARPATAEECV